MSRRLSKVDHKKVLRDVFIERRVVSALQHKKESRLVVALAFVVRLVKHFVLHNIVLIISTFQSSPDALRILLPTIAVQYAIRIFDAVLTQCRTDNPSAAAALGGLTSPKVVDYIQKDVIPIVEEVARFLNMPGVADGIETATQYIATMEQNGEDLKIEVPVAEDLARFLGRPVVAKSAEKAARRISLSNDPGGTAGTVVVVPDDPRASDVQAVASILAQLLGSPSISKTVQTTAQDASTGDAITPTRDVQPVIDGLIRLLQHPSVLERT